MTDPDRQADRSAGATDRAVDASETGCDEPVDQAAKTPPPMRRPWRAACASPQVIHHRAVARALAFLLGVSSLAAPAPATAVTSDGQVWFQVTSRVPLPHGLRLWLEVQPRFGGDGVRQLLLRPALGYAVTPAWSLYQGYGWTPRFKPFVGESRAYQESLLDLSFGDLRVVNRTRLEERFIEGVDGVSLRVRHLLRFTHPLDGARRWFLAVSDEAFATLNDTRNGPSAGFDQNRAYAGFRLLTSEHLALEVGYLHQFVNRISDDDLSANNAYVGFEYIP